MFDEKLFLELCKEYGVETKEGLSKIIIKKRDIKEEITRDDIFNIFEEDKIYFEYEVACSIDSSRCTFDERNDNQLVLAC